MSLGRKVIPLADERDSSREIPDDPPPPRVRLDTLDRIRREMGRLYVEGKAGRRDVQDVSRLANVLSLIGRLVEGADLEQRIVALEQSMMNRRSR